MPELSSEIIALLADITKSTLPEGERLKWKTISEAMLKYRKDGMLSIADATYGTNVSEEAWYYLELTGVPPLVGRMGDKLLNDIQEIIRLDSS